MSPLEQAVTTICSLTADEKRRLRDYLNAELATSDSTEPRTVDTPASIFGWGRNFVTVGDDFDAAMDDFQTRKDSAAKNESVFDAMERLALLGCVDDAPADLSTNPKHLDRRSGRDLGQ